jgi:NitT/TauT family transport system substrate-binding protein
MIKRLFVTAIFFVACHAGALAQEKIKVGYWTSGFSVGFGAVLEAGQFLQKEGLAPEFIRFSDVNAPTKALLTNSIDVAFGTSTNGAFSIAAQGAPVEMTMSSQVAESMLVTRDGSPLASPADFRGKKIGMSPAGSATYAIAVALLERNYGLKPADYTAVPGNEGQLVRFLEQGDIDAASLRSVTIASVPNLKLKKLASIIDEWKKMTKSDALPILGVAVFHKTYTREHPDGVVKFLRGMIEATRFGAREPDKAADILRKAANLDARDATSYAKLWNQIYIAQFEPQDVAGLKTMIEVYHATGTLEGNVPDAFFVTGPYEKAKQRP